MVRGGALAPLLACSGDTISSKLQFFQHQHLNGTWI